MRSRGKGKRGGSRGKEKKKEKVGGGHSVKFDPSKSRMRI